MLIHHKERHSPFIKTLAISIICLLAYNDIAFALAPKLQLSSPEQFEEAYLAETLLLAEASVHSYIQSNINPHLRRNERGVDIIGVPGLLSNTGQIAKIDIDTITAVPVVHIDSNYFVNETIIGFEISKIIALLDLWKRKQDRFANMAEWVTTYLDKPDPEIGKTSRQFADEINAKAQAEHPGIVRLYDRIRTKYVKAMAKGKFDERQKDKAESLLNFVEMWTLYKYAGNLNKGDKRGINFAAHIDMEAYREGLGSAAADDLQAQIDEYHQKLGRKEDRRTWLRQNIPELAGKTMLTISMEGNIPEFEGLAAQNANTKGGLGAYFGDKFDGLDDISMDATGMQPGYAYDRNTGEKIDYDKMAEQGLLEKVQFDYPLNVWSGVEDPVLAFIVKKGVGDKEYSKWIACEDGQNVAIKMDVYRIKRRGSSKRYLIVSPIFDYLYCDEETNPGFGRIHRFCQEVAFGRAVYELSKKMKFVPDILHLNEGHTVVAAAEMRADGDYNDMAIVVTNHTLVAAGLERFFTADVRKGVEPYDRNRSGIKPDRIINRLKYMIGAGGSKQFPAFLYPALDDNGNQIKEIGDDGQWQDVYVVDFATASVELADVVNAVSAEHAIATKKMFDEILAMKQAAEDRAARREGRAPVKRKIVNVDVIPVLNGSGRTWIMDELLNIQSEGKDPSADQLYDLHEKAKKERAFKEVEKATGIKLDPDKLTAWAIRRMVEYKSQYPVFRFLVHILTADKDKTFTREELKALWFEEIPSIKNSCDPKEIKTALDKIFDYGKRKTVNGLGMQIVVGAPKPEYVPFWADEFKRWTYNVPSLKGRFVYISGTDAKFLKMQAIGSDICINSPEPLKEACGTSDQRSGENGGVNIAVRGAGPVEWITDYKKLNGAYDGSGFLVGSYTKKAKFGRDAKRDRFYRDAPGDIFNKCMIAADIFYNNRPEWKRIMHNSYMAATHGKYIDKGGKEVITEAVTAGAMEKRYASTAYLSAIRKKRDTKEIYEVSIRDYCDLSPDGHIKTPGLKNLLNDLPRLAEFGVKYIYLLGLAEHSGRPFDVNDARNIDKRAGSWSDLDEFIVQAHRLGMLVLKDWFANQHLSKEGLIRSFGEGKGNPERFLYTNVSDGNSHCDGADTRIIRGSQLGISQEELRKRVLRGEELKRKLRMGEIPPSGQNTVPDIFGESVTYKRIDAKGMNNRRRLFGSEYSDGPIIVIEKDPADPKVLFLVSATDDVRVEEIGLPRRWPEAAQPDLFNKEVAGDAVAEGVFWLDKHVDGFRIDAALSTIPEVIRDNWGLPEGLKDNWDGVKGQNLTKHFIQEMRRLRSDCFFIFEGFGDWREPFKLPDELMSLAGNENAVTYNWPPREYLSKWLRDGNRQSFNDLIDHLIRIQRDVRPSLQNSLLNIGPEHDAIHSAADRPNEYQWATLQDHDQFLVYFMFKFLPGYELDFNGELYGIRHKYRHDAAQSAPAPRLSDIPDMQKMQRLAEMFMWKKEYPVLTKGDFAFLGAHDDVIGLARHNGSDEIIVGVFNPTLQRHYPAFNLKDLVNAQNRTEAERSSAVYVKESIKLSGDGTKWVRTSEIWTAKRMFDEGVAPALEAKGCELIRFKKVPAIDPAGLSANDGPALFVDYRADKPVVRELGEDLTGNEHQYLHAAIRQLVDFNKEESVLFDSNGVRRLTTDEAVALMGKDNYDTVSARSPPAIYIINDLMLEGALPEGYKYIAKGLITHAGTWRSDSGGRQHANLFIPRSIYQTLISDDQNPDDLRLWRVHECSHLNNREADIKPTAEETKSALNIYYARKSRTDKLPDNDRYWINNKDFEPDKERDPQPVWLFDMVKNIVPPERKTLDVGCGSGRSVASMFSRGFTNLEGVDINEGYINTARRRVPQAKFTVANIKTAQLGSRYSFIYAGDLLLYLNKEKELPDVMTKLTNSMAEGGVLALRWAVGNDEINNKTTRYVYHASEKYLRDLVTQYGLEVMHIESKIEPIYVGTPKESTCNYWYVVARKPQDHEGRILLTDVISSIKNNDELMRKALDKYVGITFQEMMKATGCESGALLNLLPALVKYGIFTPINTRDPFNLRFSDVMAESDIDHARTLLGAISETALKNVVYDGIDGFGKVYGTDKISCFDVGYVRELVKMAMISETNKEFAAPEGKTMYHIIENEVIPPGQLSSLITEVNKKLFRESKGSERVLILNQGESIAAKIREIRAQALAENKDALIDVALSDESHIGAITDRAIKKMVFKTESGTEFIQLEGVIKALRALYDEDPVPMLIRLYSIMAGMPPHGQIPVVNGVYVFNLPKIDRENINNISKLNERLLQLLTSA